MFFRERRSSDLNQLVFGVGFVETSLLRWLETCDILELFCDGMRLGTGLAFGVERRRLDAISMAYDVGGGGGECGSNVSTEFSLNDASDLFDDGDGDFFFELMENSSFIWNCTRNVLRYLFCGETKKKA